MSHMLRTTTDGGLANPDGLRVLFAGGGTGGHIIPGAAIAEALQSAVPSARCMFMVTGRQAERQCRGALKAFETTRGHDSPWQNLADKLRFPVRSILATESTLVTFGRFHPQVVVGLGGCNCIAPVLLGSLMGMRTMVIEANAVPGRAARLLAPVADCVAVQWERAASGLRCRNVLPAGSPVRMGLFDLDRATARRRLGLRPGRPTLLATGGSQGAKALNEALLSALCLLRKRDLPLQVLHITGVEHLPAALRARRRLGSAYRPVGFMERIEEAYQAADFAFARAGGSTLSYLTAAGLPSVLVPYPHHADKHQEANAQVLADAGAAFLLHQRDLNPRRLADLIGRLARREQLRAEMAERARALGRPAAAYAVAAEIATMAGMRTEMRHRPTDTGVREWTHSRAA